MQDEQFTQDIKNTVGDNLLLYALENFLFLGEDQIAYKRSCPKRVLLAMKYALKEMAEQSSEESDYTNINEVNVLFALDPRTSEWSQAGFSPASNWEMWQTFGFTPKDAMEWKQSGASLVEATAWKPLGVQNYLDWFQTGATPQEAQRWSNKDLTPQDYVLSQKAKMSVWDTLRIKSYGDVKDAINLMIKNNLNFGDIVAWSTKKIDFSEAHEWIQKGYDPKQAAKLIKQGTSCRDAQDVRKGALLPGSNYKKFFELANEHNWEIQEMFVVSETGIDKIGRVYFPIIKNEKRYYAHFLGNGKFKKLNTSTDWRAQGNKSLLALEQTLRQDKSVVASDEQ